MKRYLLIIAVLFFSRQASSGQCTATGGGLTATATPTAASCPLNGSIAIAVTGSSSGGPYTFILSGPCLSSGLNQSQASPNYTFNSLQGNCTYTACISDAGGNIISRTVTVADNYPVITGAALWDTMFTSIACSKLAAAVSGGRTPYNYELFPGMVAAGTPIQGPQSSNVFSNISPATQYTVRITDACGQSIIRTRFTGNLIPQALGAGSYALESCSSIREVLQLNNAYGGSLFATNDISEASAAGLKFPVIITARDHNGNFVPGYPYTLTGAAPAPWGQSANTALNIDLQWSPPLPNDPALFPVTFSYTAGCGASASTTLPYNAEFHTAAYAIGGTSYTDITQCPPKICLHFGIGGDYVAGTNYTIGAYTNPAATGTPIRTIIYPAQQEMCGLEPLTVYYFKVHDPCLNKDTITSKTTTALNTGPFTVAATNCNTYCNGNIISTYTYTGAPPNSVMADSGPASFGPYPKSVTFSAGPDNISITAMPPGTYHFTFYTPCGETAGSNATLLPGNLYASPLHSLMNTGCGSALVKITPHISSSGQMFAYHSSPGCHSTAGTAYYANIIFQPPAGAPPVQGSGSISVDNPDDGYSVNVNSPGLYVAFIAYSQGLPGQNNAVSYCYQTVIDTFEVSLPPIPSIVRMYTLPCSGSTYSIVPVAPNAVTGTLYTLYASNGTTILAGPQTSNVFPNISTGLGTGLIVKAQDPCGQSSIVPVSLNTGTTINGSVNCFIYNNGGVPASADSLKADFINGATYLWTAPDGITFTGANPAPVIPGQAGVWTLSTTLQNGLCSSVLTNSFTTALCAQGGVPPNPTDPRADTIHLDGVVNLCKTTLTWTTKTEINSLNFYVEESDDNSSWTRVAVIAAAGTSSTPRTYNYTIDPSARHKFYRIRQTDTDGRIKYSNTIELSTDCSSGTDILTGDNPVDHNVFTFYLPAGVARGNAFLIFVDAIGREYFSRPEIINRGMNVYQFRPQQILAKGTYFVRMITADGSWRSNTVKVVFIK